MVSYWFRLEPADATKDRRDQTSTPGLFTLVATGKLETILEGRELTAFERTVAPRFLPSRRWFAHKDTQAASVSVADFAVLRDGGQSRFVLPILDVKLADGSVETYFAPLAAEPESSTRTRPRTCRRTAAPRRLDGSALRSGGVRRLRSGHGRGAAAQRNIANKQRRPHLFLRRRLALATSL